MKMTSDFATAVAAVMPVLMLVGVAEYVPLRKAEQESRAGWEAGLLTLYAMLLAINNGVGTLLALAWLAAEQKRPGLPDDRSMALLLMSTLMVSMLALFAMAWLRTRTRTRSDDHAAIGESGPRGRRSTQTRLASRGSSTQIRSHARLQRQASRIAARAATSR